MEYTTVAWIECMGIPYDSILIYQQPTWLYTNLSTANLPIVATTSETLHKLLQKGLEI